MRTIFEQPDTNAVFAQHRQVVAALEAKFPDAADHLDAARDDILAFVTFPKAVWRQVWSNNPQGSNASTKRYADGPTWSASSPTAPPSSASSAPCSPNRDEWTEQRRYMGTEILAQCRQAGPANTETGTNVTTDTGVTIEPISAQIETDREVANSNTTRMDATSESLGPSPAAPGSAPSGRGGPAQYGSSFHPDTGTGPSTGHTGSPAGPTPPDWPA